MSGHNQEPPAQGEDELPGDTNAADIVGPTGEEMPVQTHDEVDAPPAPPPSPRRPADDRTAIRPDTEE